MRRKECTRSLSPSLCLLRATVCLRVCVSAVVGRRVATKAAGRREREGTSQSQSVSLMPLRMYHCTLYHLLSLSHPPSSLLLPSTDDDGSTPVAPFQLLLLLRLLLLPLALSLSLPLSLAAPATHPIAILPRLLAALTVA